MSKKTLIVYYSLTGNVRMVINSIKDALEADVLEIKPIKDLNPEGGAKFAIGGFQAKSGFKPELKPYDVNPLDYNLIILASPTHAWTVSAPIRSFLSKHDLKGKDIALLLSAMGDGIKAMERFKAFKYLKFSNIVGEITFQEPKKKDPEIVKNKAVEWAKKPCKLTFFDF